MKVIVVLLIFAAQVAAHSAGSPFCFTVGAGPHADFISGGSGVDPMCTNSAGSGVSIEVHRCGVATAVTTWWPDTEHQIVVSGSPELKGVLVSVAAATADTVALKAWNANDIPATNPDIQLIAGETCVTQAQLLVGKTSVAVPWIPAATLAAGGAVKVGAYGIISRNTTNSTCNWGTAVTDLAFEAGQSCPTSTTASSTTTTTTTTTTTSTTGETGGATVLVPVVVFFATALAFF